MAEVVHPKLSPEDEKFVREMEESNKHKLVKLIISSPAAIRSILGVSVKASAVSGSLSACLASINNSTGTSAGLVKLSKHINQVLDGESPRIDELSLSTYLGRIDILDESRVLDPDGGYSTFNPPPGVWDLMAIAAKHSAAAYDKNAPDGYQGFLIKPKTILHHIKATRIERVEMHGEGIIVVSIRGSASLDDWLLNLNGDSIATSGREMLDESGLWHRGFWESFRSSQREIAQAIRHAAAKYPDARRLLFTGHSAGGAIAQLCYNSCSLAESDIAKAVLSFTQLDCITFGAPPVSTMPISPRAGTGVFLSVMNEGDPVVLAQEESIKTLFSVYFLSKMEWDTRYSLGFVVPLLDLHPSGTCVLLRDCDEDGEEDVVEAIEYPSELLERALFGNFLLHPMRVYLRRLESLAETRANGVSKGGHP